MTGLLVLKPGRDFGQAATFRCLVGISKKIEGDRLHASCGWGARWCHHRAVTHTREGVDIGILEITGDGLAVDLGRDRVVAPIQK